MVNRNICSVIEGGNGVGNLFTDSLYLGCFADNQQYQSGFQFDTIPLNYSGIASIRWCYQHALQHEAYYFALRGSNVCYYGYEFARFDSQGPSNGCFLTCGTESYSSGAICGGVSSLSVYQIEVNIYNEILILD